jgi:hypothetical protein
VNWEVTRPFGMASVEISCKNLKKASRQGPRPSGGSLRNALKCMYLNATSLDNKLDEFKAILETNRPDIVAVSETWFKSTSVVNVRGYTIYRKDRMDGRRGGGVCLYISDSICSFQIIIDSRLELARVEQVWAALRFGSDKYLIGCLYRPGEHPFIDDFELVFTRAREYVDNEGYKELLVMGDFNLPSVQWADGDAISIKDDNSSGNRFCELIGDSFLYQHVNMPTFQLSNGVETSTLDLIFTTESGAVSALKTSFVQGNIDRGHFVLFFDFVLKNKPTEGLANSLKYVYSKANYEEISRFMANIDWVRLFENLSVQQMYDELIFYASAAVNEFVPFVDASRAKGSTPWVDEDLKALIRAKKDLRYKNCACKWADVAMKKDYKLVCKRVSIEIKKSAFEL